MALEDQTKAALTAVSELAKQLITLSTGIVALEVTFASSMFKNGIPKFYQLHLSWFFLLLSIIGRN